MEFLSLIRLFIWCLFFDLIVVFSFRLARLTPVIIVCLWIPKNFCLKINMVSIQLSHQYGWVILVGVASSFLLVWQGMQVGKMRKKFKIQYPTMYSTDNDVFNCYQRAHQNTLENYPQFLMLLFIGGIQFPFVTALAGVVWILGKIAYSLGYYTGDPAKRMKGSFGYIGLITMLGTTVCFALNLLGYL